MTHINKHQKRIPSIYVYTYQLCLIFILLSCSSSSYVSVNPKPDHPPPLPGDPADSHVLTAWGVGFSPKFLCPGGRGFELEKFSTVLNEKCKNFSICFKETGGSLKSRCSCAVSYQFLQTQ